MRATSSVMNANLLLFKTVIAGDSWGLIAVPVIEHYPGTAIIFVGSLLTIVFGVLNLIVAVVVDTFAEARERDVLNLAEEMERNHENDKKFLQKVFDRIDEDGSGELTLEELVEGARKDPEFQSRLRVMDIDEVDLQQLFEMIDADGSGSIEAAEFIAPLSRWVHESKTAPRFIKYNMLRTMQQQEELYRLSHYQFTAVSSRLDDLTGALDALQAEYRQPIAPELTAPLMGLDRERPETAEGAEETRETNKRRLSRMSLRSTQSLDEVDLPELERQELSARFDIPNELDMEHPKASRLAELAKCQESERSAASQASAGGRPRSAFAGPFKAAMDSLERSLLSATEQALKQSMAMVEMALQDELHQVKRPTRSRRPSDHDAAGSRSSVRLPWSSLFPGIPLAMRADEQELKRSSRTQSHVRAGNRSGRPSEAASPPTSASPAAARDDGVSRSNSSKGFRYLDSDSLAMPVNRRAARHSIAGVHLQLSRGF
ncbi:unnamed protein product [Effrenium voratum]|nr:unnamed protein product [Effrenium voratum]